MDAMSRGLSVGKMAVGQGAMGGGSVGEKIKWDVGKITCVSEKNYMPW